MYRAKVRAYAKVNLTLEIVGRENGYHELDSLVASVDVYDTVILKKRKGKLSSIRMFGKGSESIPPEKNNALIAAERYSARFGTDGADVTVYKNIPMGAGMGGSSADIAGVLVGMQRLYKAATDEELFALAGELGSDVQVMLEGGYSRMQGRGERVTPIHGVKQPLNFLLICPSGGVSAGACYQEYDRLHEVDKPSGYTEKAIEALQSNDVYALGRYLMNDLYIPSANLCKDVGKALEEARSFSPIAAVMTGSGSAVLALFETEELCRWAKSRYRGKFHVETVKTVDVRNKKSWSFPFALRAEELENERK
ncbi:MAG: 4-(cytidine 5'-diphospho)-2-C-methyl-D-erythritol kinase [Clostridia bacterium]|nr:4-(cytidine 5'-diphospho)-2-C-methyl-D-erythritol kinase [Clostridia bacterium]